MNVTQPGEKTAGSTPPTAPCVRCQRSHPPSEPCDGAVQNSKPTTVVPPPPRDEVLGTRVGNFKIVRLLGKGGMGTVYLGEHALIGSRVAIKFLHPHLAREESLVKRFFAEARAANLIGHENIVSIFDLSLLPPDRYFLVMEYLEGQPLSTLLGKPHPPEEVVPVLLQACDALQAAHSAGVIHCDLKPENIFLLRRGENDRFVKLVDFGIAKLLARPQGTGTTVDGAVIGTPEFMAPEQWLGRELDGRVDIYALGVVAYALATGRLPFEEPSALAYFAAHQKKQPVPPRQLVPSLPEAYGAAIERALAKRPEDRFQSALEMREALRGALERRTAPPQPQSRPTVGSSRPPSFQARISGPNFPERTLATADLSRAGLFVVAEPPLPPVRERVKVALLHPQRTLEAEAEVVRHVDASQAAQWNMPGPGFAVQFVEPSQDFRKVIGRIIEGRPLDAPTRASVDDPSAKPILDGFERRPNDPYALLGVRPDAECSEIRHQSRQTLTQLDELAARPLSERQREQLSAIRWRIESASTELGTPVRRAERDAGRGNFRGVARCLAAGLAPKELEALRTRFLAMRSRNETNAKLHTVAANALINSGDLQTALEKLEAALGLDPLNLQLHQSYWALMRRILRARG